MSALLAIFLVLLLTAILMFFVLQDFGIASRKQKAIVIILLFLFTVTVGAYSYFQNRSDKNDLMLQISFLNGQSLECEEIIVSKENFNLVTGTLNFIGKKSGPMKNIIIPLEKCKIIEKDKEESARNLQEELQRD